jgi:coatomer subunit gamma
MSLLHTERHCCRKKGKKVARDEATPAVAHVNTDDIGKEIETMPQFANLGPRFRSCKPLPLIDEGLEYVVTCIKHIFDRHIVLQFNCTNTFKEQVRVSV